MGFTVQFADSFGVTHQEVSRSVCNIYLIFSVSKNSAGYLLLFKQGNDLYDMFGTFLIVILA